MVKKIIFYENHFMEFYQNQDEKVKSKIQYVFELIKQVERVPKKFLVTLKELMGYMRCVWNSNQIFTGFSAVLMKEGLLSYLTAFKRRLRRHRRRKKRKLKD